MLGRYLVFVVIELQDTSKQTRDDSHQDIKLCTNGITGNFSRNDLVYVLKFLTFILLGGLNVCVMVNNWLNNILLSLTASYVCISIIYIHLVVCNGCFENNIR